MQSFELLDGAMGSELIRRGLSLPNHIWSAWANIFNPKLVKAIHDEYVEAGCHYITTNTFRTTHRAYTKTGLNADEAKEMSHDSLKAAVSMANKAAKKRVKVLGSIAPLEDCYQPNLFPGALQAKKEFEVIAMNLFEEDIDGFIIETMNSIPETIVCLETVEKFNIPTWVSFTLGDAQHLLSGETIKLVVDSLSSFSIDCLLLNCNEISRTSDAMNTLACYYKNKWGIYPNLGIGKPSADGLINKYSSDQSFLDVARKALDLGANVLGACCGSSPRHLRLLKNM